MIPMRDPIEQFASANEDARKDARTALTAALNASRLFAGDQAASDAAIMAALNTLLTASQIFDQADEIRALLPKPDMNEDQFRDARVILSEALTTARDAAKIAALIRTPAPQNVPVVEQTSKTVSVLNTVDAGATKTRKVARIAEKSELDRARDALYSIPPDLPRDQWLRALMGAHAAGIPVDDVEQWSAGADSFNASDFRSVWKSIKPGGVGVGTLFAMAADHGRHNGDRPATSPKQATKRPAEPPRKPTPGMGPADVWNRAVEATNEHPYIVENRAAGVPLDALRVLPAGDPLRIAGEPMAGALVVPIRRADDSLSSLQFITLPEVSARFKAKGKPGKLNLPGATLEGWHTVGELVPGGVVHICEGIATAWACWQASSSLPRAAAVACCGWGRVRAVAAELRERDASARLVLVPDSGKEQDAEKIAREHGCAVATMPEGEASNFDANDYAQREGFDALEMLLERATEPAPPPRLLKPVSVSDVLTHPSPPPEFVWAGYLPRGTVSLLGAHGGTGKSTIALMLEVCAALGRPLFGIPTVQCKTLFVSLEDSAHIIRHRLAFICKAWAIDPAELDGKLQIVDGCENPELFGAESRGAGSTTATYAELRQLVDGVGLVVIDNASDAYGGDEIQRRQVRAFVRSLGALARLTDCAVLLLAHVDKNTSRARKPENSEGYSGSTAWHNSVRSRIFMTRAEDGTLSLEHQKSNFGSLCDPLTLTWPKGGLPQLVQAASAFSDRMEARAQDNHAAVVLRMIAEFEGREQYCSPAPQARNNVFAMLRSEPAFQVLKLRADDTRRIVNQCQRAKWIEPLVYRSHDRKDRQRWTLTPEGRAFAGVAAPTAPTCAHMPTSDDGAQGANGGAPTAPTYAGGVGESARANVSAERGYLSGAEPLTTDSTNLGVGAASEQGADHD